MQRTLINLPLEIRLEIGDCLSLGDLTRFTRTCKSIARVHISRLYDCSFSPEVKLSAPFIAAQWSEFVLEYVAAKADKLLARRYYPRSTLLQGVVQADNELWLDIFIKHGIDINCLADDGWSLLHAALGLGCDKVAVKLLDAGADVLFPAAGRYPTVGLAVNEIPRATVDGLIAAFQQAGGDITAPGPDGICTALHYTSRRGSHLTAKALIEHGADVLAMSARGYMPLFPAIWFRHHLCSEILLEAMARDPRGYDINIRIPVIKRWEHLSWDEDTVQRPGVTILHAAVSQEDTVAIRLLLKYGADPQAKDHPTDGWPETPFSLAVKAMKPPLIYAFLNADNPRERFPAGIDWGSIIQFHSGIMRAMSTQTRIHVPPLRLNRPGQLYVDINTALPHVFAVCKSYGAQPSAQAVNKCIMALVEAGLPVNHPDESGVTLLHYLCDWDNGGDIAKKVELVGFLLDHGADWTTRAFIPRDTVLHRLARAGLLPGSFDDVICRIVREWPGSPDISAVNDHGYTVLHLYSERTILSCSAGKDMVRLLVQAGCDLNVRNNWGYAVAHGNPSPLDSIKAVDFFADLGMDLNLPDSMGRPPLHYVVCNKPVYVRRHEQEAIVRYLLEKGVAPHPGCQSCE